MNAASPSHQIRILSDQSIDRLSERQRSAAFDALVSYLATECEKPRVTKKALVDAVETACAWADSNVKA